MKIYETSDKEVKELFEDGVEIVDRYIALGIPHPDPLTMCKDQCEGTGIVPVSKGDLEEPWKTLWEAAEEKEPADDGWHFVTCPTCHGTGLEPTDDELCRLTRSEYETLKELSNEDEGVNITESLARELFEIQKVGEENYPWKQG